MKKIYLTLLSFLFINSLFAGSNNLGVVISDPKQDLNIVVSNMCEYYSLMMVCEGDSNTGMHPVLASTNCWASHYTFYDSLLLFKDTKILTFANYGAAPYGFQKMFVANETTIISFETTYINYSCDSIVISPQDTLVTDSIISGEAYSNDYLAVIRNSSTSDNFYVYDVNLSYLFSLHLNMTPKFLSVNQSAAFAAVVGINQNNETVLNLIDVPSQQIIKDTILGTVASKPASLRAQTNKAYIISQPRDSVVNFIQYSYVTGVLDSMKLYSGSGVNTDAWDSYRYHFQPKADFSGNNYDYKILVLNIFNMTVDTFDIAKRLKLLAETAGVSYNDYPLKIGVDSLNPNVAYFYYDSNYTLADSINTPSPPELFAGDFRCPVKISEYDDSKVQWKVYPNPTGDNIKLSASGLICGREYNLDIIDEMGKVVYQTTTHAKTTVVLPTSNFDPGIYFVRIHTLNGPVVQQIIKQ
jgi:hypothetical protein